MLGAFVAFELRSRIRMLSTYVYAAILFAAGLFLMLSSAGIFKGISTASGSERIFANGPHTVFGTMNLIALFGLFTIAAVFGQAAFQDFGHGTWMIIFTKNVKKGPYLLGRFFGALVFSAVLFLAIAAGQALGAGIAQMIDASQLGPHRLDVYLWPYLVSIWPTLFICGAAFFCLAALTRQMAPVYVGVVVMVLGYLVLSVALGDVQNKTMGALLDPFGFLTFDVVTRYWTPDERNHDLVPFSGFMLANRLLWMTVAALALAFTFKQFRTTVDEVKGKGSVRDDENAPSIAIPMVPVHPTTSSWMRTALSSAWLQFRDVLRSPVYWSFIAAGLSFVLFGILLSKQIYGTATLPVTYQVLELAIATFGLFTLITITFYAGELVWRERDASLADIVDASRVPSWVGFTSKVVALWLVAASLQMVVGLAALASQVFRGYFAIEPGLYFSELVLFGFLRTITLCVLAISAQVVVNQKYLGHAVMVLYYVSQITLRLLGVEERLLRYGTEPGVQYSDMNGYGHWIPAALWHRTYWYSIAGILLALMLLLVVRGRETGWRRRMALARTRVTRGWIGAVVVCGLIAASIAGYLLYEMRVRHHYATAKDGERHRAQYEKTYKATWDGRPQPRIVDADVKFDIFPEEKVPRLVASGTYTVENKSQVAIRQVLMSLPEDAKVRSLSLGTATKPVQHDEKLGLFVFELSPPLPPGAKAPLVFDLEFTADPIVHGDRREDVVGNGTFFNNFNLPVIGYNDRAELSDDGKRKSYKLAPKQRMADRDDLKARQDNYIRRDSDFIGFRAEVSTVPDQIAIAPGYLVKEWTENGRRHFRYEMDQPILNFFSVLSARYEVKRDQWNGVNLEIYYHPTHTANLDRMMQGMKDALAYCSEAFGPYQHRQARIIEFPRYAGFAQSFPNTIPYSEGVGFIAQVDDNAPNDLDYPYYITAHEIAHQWWAHQVVGGNVQGATMTSETMAQYSALMVMKKRFGPAKMKRFLKYELDRYLIGRITESKKELPLARNENQAYIHYQKGSLAMYALQDFIGEDKVNAALKKYVTAVRFKGPPYTNATELLGYLRAETPEAFAYLIDDLFERITLYDNRTESASMKKNAAGGWDVTLKVKAVKYRSDDKGKQSKVEFADYMDVGGVDADGAAIYLEKRKVPEGESTITFSMPTKPAKVGVDPLNKLVDRNGDDNVTVPSGG